MDHTQTTFIDLCCGIGGFHQALKNMGMTCVFACDIDKDCRDNYELNYNITPEKDINDIDIPSIPAFDVLCAGFPCQSFSKAGHQKGFDDERGHIFFRICDIISHHNPKYIILENVKNLSSHDNGNTWITIKQSLQHLQYNVYDTPMVLNTLHFGIPQSRERVVIICKRADIGELPPKPIITQKQETSILSILEKEYDAKYNISPKLRATRAIWNDFLTILRNNKIKIPKFPIWTDWWDSDGVGTTVTKYNKKLTPEENHLRIQKAQQDFYKKYTNWIDKNRNFYNTYKHLLQPWLTTSRNNVLWKGAVRKMEWQADSDQLSMEDVLWSPRGSGVRIKNTNYTPTLVAMASMIPIYNDRHLTPRECARLQSFPDDYIIHEKDTVSYKQFGNAVNVYMIERCARFLINNEPILI